MKEKLIQQVQAIEDPQALEVLLDFTQSLIAKESAETEPLTKEQKELLVQRKQSYQAHPENRKDAFEHLKGMVDGRGWVL